MTDTTELELPQTMRLEDAPVPADTPPDAPAEVVNPRDAAMRRVVENYERQQAEQIAEGDRLFREAAEREAAAAAELEPEAPATTEHRAVPGTHAQIQAPTQPEAAPSLRTINVQGHELQVTEDQFEHLARIGVVANLALQGQQAAPQYRPPPAPPAHQAASQPPLDRERAAQIVQRLSYGTPDDGVAALQELAGTLTSRVDPQAVAAAATQQVMQTIQLQNDLGAIGREFPDIFNNEDRSYLAAIRLTRIRERDAALGQVRPAIDQYREACGATLQGLGIAPSQPVSQPGGAGVRLSGDRLARIRSAPRHPSSVSRAASLGEVERRAPTNSEIVAQIRRGRGQMV